MKYAVHNNTLRAERQRDDVPTILERLQSQLRDAKFNFNRTGGGPKRLGRREFVELTFRDRQTALRAGEWIRDEFAG